MKSVSSSLLSLVAGLSLSLVVGCGDSGSAGGFGGNAGKGGSGVAGQSSRGGAKGTSGAVPASGGATGCTRCDANPDIGTTGGAGGRSGTGGSTAGPDATDVAWPDVPSTGGAGGSIDSGTGGRLDSGTGGSIDSGTGGSIDSGTDGSVDRSLDTQACINLGDIPTAYVRTEDSATRVSSMWVMDGPCNASALMMQVNFYYWETGYSCPGPGDRVTCQVEATSLEGATTVFSLDFVAVPLGGSMLHWQAEPSQITLTFPSLDGGAMDGARAGE